MTSRAGVVAKGRAVLIDPDHPGLTTEQFLDVLGTGPAGRADDPRREPAAGRAHL